MKKRFEAKVRMSDGLDGKVVLLGATMVGKTSIVSAATTGAINPDAASTVGASYASKTVKTQTGNIRLQVWDTAGQERFRTLAPMYYRGASVALLVFSVIDKNSLQEVSRWAEELQQHTTQKTALIVVGNKIDLITQRVVSKEDAMAVSAQYQAEYVEVSALDGTGIEDLFYKAALCVEQNPPPAGSVPVLTITPADEKKKGCC